MSTLFSLLAPVPQTHRQKAEQRRQPFVKPYIPPSEDQLASLFKGAVTRADKARAAWVMKHGHRPRHDALIPPVAVEEKPQQKQKAVSAPLSAFGNLVSGTIICIVGHPFDTVKVCWFVFCSMLRL